MKYVFLDIDGTIYDNKNGIISESTRNALELAAKNGNKLFVNTGRSCCMLEHVKDINYDGVIAAAGAYVEVDGNIIFEENILPDKLQEIIDCCHELEISYILEGKKGIYFDSVARKYFETAGRDGGVHEFLKMDVVNDADAFLSSGDIIYKLCIYAENVDKLQNIKKVLPEDYHFTSGGVKTEDVRFIEQELTLKKNNKASGIRKVLEYYNADIKDTIGIGDSMNDFEMIKECAVGIAMGNADDKLKNYADYITADVDKEGITQAFVKYGLI